MGVALELSEMTSSACSPTHRRQGPFSVGSVSDLIDSVQSQDELLALQNEQRRQHNATILDQLRAISSFCSELQHRNTALTSDFTSLTAVHRQLQAEYKYATTSNSALQDELAQCKRERKEERERMEVDVMRRNAALAELTQQLTAITASHQQKDQSLATVTRERDAMRRRIDTLEDELTESTTDCEQLSGQLRAAEEERDEWVEENTRLETRLKASEVENVRMTEAKDRVEQELQAHLDIAETIHGLSRKAMASRDGSRTHGCKTQTAERVMKPRIVLGELDMNRT